MTTKRRLVWVVCITVVLVVVQILWDNKVISPMAVDFFKNPSRNNMATINTKAYASSSSSSSSASFSPAKSWSDTLVNSTDYFWDNDLGIVFQTDVTMDAELARLSVAVTFQHGQERCPFPYFRVRLTGAAVVHVPLALSTTTNTNTNTGPNAHNESSWSSSSSPSSSPSSTPTSTTLSGSAWIPTPGQYFLEVMMLHCTMDSFNYSMTPADIKALVPPQPVIHPNLTLTDYSFTVPPFQRTPKAIQQWIAEFPALGPFPFGAWIFLPRCQQRFATNDTVSEKHCVTTPTMIRTKVQVDEYRQYLGIHPKKVWYMDPLVQERFDNYVFLPVNRANGAVDTDTDYTTRTRVPSPDKIPLRPGPPIQFNESHKMCFVGDSFFRYMHYEAIQILQNTTLGTDACDNSEFHTDDSERRIVNSTDTNTLLINLLFASDWVRIPRKDKKQLSKCAVLYITVGRWDAGLPRSRPTPAKEYATLTKRILQDVEGFTRNTTRTYWIPQPTPMPIGSMVLTRRDWRLPPLLEAYQRLLLEDTDMTLPIETRNDPTLPGLPKFNIRGSTPLERTYILDVSDISDPLWDDPADFCHPCRHGFREMVVRLLQLALLELERQRDIYNDMKER